MATAVAEPLNARARLHFVKAGERSVGRRNGASQFTTHLARMDRLNVDCTTTRGHSAALVRWLVNQPSESSRPKRAESLSATSDEVTASASATVSTFLHCAPSASSASRTAPRDRQRQVAFSDH